MASVEDVLDALAARIAAFLEAAGPPAVITVFPGWPLANDINAAMAAGKVLVSVYQQPGMTTNVTRFRRDWEVLTPAAISTTVSIAGDVVTFGGTITLPLNVGIRALNKDYGYTAVSGETLASLATALAALLSGDLTASASGPQLTISSAPLDFSIALGGKGVIVRENVRIKQGFQITIWAPNPTLRRAAADAFEAAMFGDDRFSLPDGTVGMLSFERSAITDVNALQAEYRKDIFTYVEFGMTEAEPAWSVVKFHPQSTAA